MAEGKFKIRSINRMEEGLEIITGVAAGVADENGEYPEGTINYLVMKRLTQITEAMRPAKDEGEEKSDESSSGGGGCDTCR